MANGQQAALAVVGAAVGFFVGGPAGAYYGLQAGLIAGGLLFPEDLPGQQGPRIADSSVTSSTIGTAIPIIFGTTVTAGNIIWTDVLVEHENTQDVGGKGGPKQEQTTFTYTRSYAVALCEGTISGVLRMWRNEKLVYDIRPQQDGEDTESYAERMVASEALAEGFIVYTGSQIQLADPTIEAVEGVGNVPAHRGIAYVVFTDEDVTDNGGRVPNWRFEISVNAASSVSTTTQYAPSAFFEWDTASVDPRNCDNDHEYRHEPSGPWRSTFQAALDDASAFIGRTLNDDILGYVLEDTGGAAQVYPHTATLASDPEKLYLLVNSDDFIGTSSLQASTICEGMFAITGGVWPSEKYWWIGQYVGGLYNPTGVFRVHSRTGAVDTPTPSDGASSNGGCTLFVDGGAPDPTAIIFSVQDTRIAVRRKIRQPDPPCIPRCEDPYPILPENANYCVINNAIENIVGYSLAAGSWKALSNLRVASELVTDYPLGPIVASGAAGDTQAAWEAAYAAALAAGEHIRSGLVYGVDYPVTPTAAYERSYSLTSLDPTPPTVGSIVAALCARTGMPPGKVDVSDLTEIVPGYRIASVMTARQAIQPMQAYTFFDCVESECILKFPTRGKSLIDYLDQDSLGAHNAGEERPPLVSMERQQDVELPRQMRVHYECKSKDYQPSEQKSLRLTTDAVNIEDVELAIAMEDDKAAQIADVLLQDTWWARERYKAITSPEFLSLEPGDCIELPIEGQTERARIVGMDMPLPFGPLSLELVRDDDGSYVSHAVGASPVPSTDTPSLIGPTVMEIIDGPALESNGNDAGFYVAVRGVFNGWRGATIYESVDSGTTYTAKSSISFAATMGAATDILPEGPTSIWDEGNTLTVLLDNGTLESKTEDAVLAGGNAAFYGVAGRWELIQFRTATLNMDGTYTLSGLLRGRRGTEWTVGLHEAADKFILVGSGLGRISLDGDALNQTRLYKAVSLGTLVQSATAQSVTISGIALECYSVANIAVDTDATGIKTVTWQRRSRYGSEMPSGADVPLNEETESYDWELLDSTSAIVSSGSVTEPLVQVEPLTLVATLEVAIQAAAAIDGNIYGITTDNASLSVRAFDGTTFSYLAGIGFGSGDAWYLTGFTTDSTAIYVTSRGTSGTGGDGLFKIPITAVLDEDFTDITTYSTSNGDAQGLCFVGTNVWIAQTVSQDVTEINPASMTVVSTIDVSGLTDGGPGDVSTDGTDLYVSLRGSTGKVARLTTVGGVVWSITAASRYVCDTLVVGSYVWVLRSDGLEAYATSDGTAQLIDDTDILGSGVTANHRIIYDGTHVIVRLKRDGVIGYRKYDPVTLEIFADYFFDRYYAGSIDSNEILTTDPIFGAPTSYVYGGSNSAASIRIYQISAIEGRGQPAEESL